MIKIIQILLCFSFCFTIKTFSQKCISPYQPGVYLFENIKINSLCYLRDADKMDNNIFHTFYTFKVDRDKENYSLDFYFNKEENTISIYFSKGSNSKENKTIKIEPEGSLVMFNDYKTNDLTIRQDVSYTTIFTISNPEEPYITLNQFQMWGSPEILFKLRDIDNDKLLLHNLKAKEYLSTIKDPGRENKIDIESMKKEMTEYQDSILKQIEKDDLRLIEKLWPREAESEVLHKITNQLNSEFYKYLKNVFLYQDINCQMEFNFKYGDDGKNLVLKKINFINSLPVKWLEDSIRAFVIPKLKQLKFDPMNIALSNDNMVENFKKRFSDRINKLDLNNKNERELKDNYEKIIEKLEIYSRREKTLNTEFTYKLEYKSKVKYEVWKYEQKSRKSEEKLFIENSNEQITPELRILFFKNITTEKRKEKYMIKRAEITINKDKPVEDLKPNY